MTWIKASPTRLTVTYASGRKEEIDFHSRKAAQTMAEKFEKLDTVKSVAFSSIKKGKA